MRRALGGMNKFIHQSVYIKAIALKLFIRAIALSHEAMALGFV
jgi:hypothetical protein